MELNTALAISARGMDAQTNRLRVIAENLANQDATGTLAGGKPYQRKTITFSNQFDQTLGTNAVKVKQVGRDSTEFPLRYDPGHPAADRSGYIKTPNVNSFVEVMDMREAERSYAANLAVMQVSRSMLTRTVEMLK
ncbi:MAG: flagellar basal body rod protein FlgC [Acetobacteraceae bacterium]|nr:flagellar basal body rod protein FlgC [Acetobacteraceae bacterium]